MVVAVVVIAVVVIAAAEKTTRHQWVAVCVGTVGRKPRRFALVGGMTGGSSSHEDIAVILFLKTTTTAATTVATTVATTAASTVATTTDCPPPTTPRPSNTTPIIQNVQYVHVARVRRRLVAVGVQLRGDRASVHQVLHHFPRTTTDRQVQRVQPVLGGFVDSTVQRTDTAVASSNATQHDGEQRRVTVHANVMQKTETIVVQHPQLLPQPIVFVRFGHLSQCMHLREYEYQ